MSGDQIRFWLDIWIEDKPLCVQFNRIFRLELNPNCKVCERWGNGGWTWNRRKVVRGGIEHEQLKNLLSTLKDIKLQEGSDEIYWSLDGESDFTVASTRRHIDAFLHIGSDMGTLW